MPLDDTNFNGGGGGDDDHAFVWCIYDTRKISGLEVMVLRLVGVPYMARPFTVDSKPMSIFLPGCCLPHLRQCIQEFGFTSCAPRDPDDDPAIIESWL